jgi:DNA-binding NarL/FixJ family response regulator
MNITHTPSPDPIRVALVEDEPTFHAALKNFIASNADMDCVGAFSSAEAALEAIPSSIDPEIILMDINLPGQTGIEATRTLKQRATTAEIMMLTTNDDSENVLQALKAGATGYILKNSTLREVGESIRQLHSGGAPMSQAIARHIVRSFAAVLPSSPLTAEAAKERTAEGDGTSLLSDREREVLGHLTKGYRYKDIADKLGISIETVKVHIKRIYEKLHIRSKSELIERFSD